MFRRICIYICMYVYDVCVIYVCYAYWCVIYMCHCYVCHIYVMYVCHIWDSPYLVCVSVCLCVCTYTCHNVCLEVRGQLERDCCLFPSHYLAWVLRLGRSLLSLISSTSCLFVFQSFRFDVLNKPLFCHTV